MDDVIYGIGYAILLMLGFALGYFAAAGFAATFFG